MRLAEDILKVKTMPTSSQRLQVAYTFDSNL